MSDQCAGQWFLRASGLGDDDYQVSLRKILQYFCAFTTSFSFKDPLQSIILTHLCSPK